MNNKILYRSAFSFVLPIGLLFMLFIVSQQNKSLFSPTKSVTDGEKQRGGHVFSIRDSTNLKSLHQNNLEWITLVPWGFQDDVDSPIVTHQSKDSVRNRKHESNWVNKIKMVRSKGYKVFFKPHLWVQEPSDGKWRSDIYPTDDENWELWKTTYSQFILRYAKVAERAEVEMYCIGIEFSRLSVEKPKFWRALIKEVRNVYSGKITYAANWYKEYEKVTFWKDLDFIGIQAYFPLTKKENPSIKQISKGWKKHIPSIKKTSKKYNRHVLFTEIGYRSTSSSAIRPWEWMEYDTDAEITLSFETQANCYQAFFNSVWKEDWFAGAHFWQFRGDFDPKNDYFDLDFTPQGKPAALILAKGYEND
ncbi:MAG: hypothetical protein P1U56_25420 [Saprospiraceae bacterium]|nr:hypothetical protein [Saprospiraceae bacterium]